MGKKKFKILATNGSWIKEFMYFIQTPAGDIYYGEVNLRTPDKISRHVTGLSHHKRGEQITKLGQGLRLTEYVGLHQLFVMSIGKSVFESPPFGKAYSKKIGENILIDINEFDLRVGIIGFLLEPNRLESLDKLSEKLRDVKFVIKKEMSPWFVIAVFNDGREIDKDAITPFEWNKALIKLEIPSSKTGGTLVMITAPGKK